MKFIKLNKAGVDEDLYLNCDHIVGFRPTQGGTTIWLSTASSVDVTETCRVVLRQIRMEDE